MNDWPLKNAHKETVASFEQQLRDTQQALWGRKKLFVWGAGVRGTLLGLLLEKNNHNSFSYIDGDSRKWGMNICGHMIQSPEELWKTSPEDLYVLIPLEYSEDVQKILEKHGMVEQRHFSVIRSTEKQNFQDTFFSQYDKKILLIGGSLFNEILLCEEHDNDLKEDLRLRYGSTMKVLSMNSISIGGYYYLYRLQLLCGQVPEQVWIFISWDLLTEYVHKLPRSQHVDLLEALKNKSGVSDDTLDCYLTQASLRAVDYKMELEHSPLRVFDGERPSSESVHRGYLKKSLLYSVNTETESFDYLKSIVDLSCQYGIKCRMFITPYNYELVEEYFGSHAKALVGENFAKLQQFFNLHDVPIYDMGRLLPNKDFETAVTVNDAISKEGRKKILQQLGAWGL